MIVLFVFKLLIISELIKATQLRNLCRKYVSNILCKVRSTEIKKLYVYCQNITVLRTLKSPFCVFFLQILRCYAPLFVKLILLHKNFKVITVLMHSFTKYLVRPFFRFVIFFFNNFETILFSETKICTKINSIRFGKSFFFS